LSVRGELAISGQASCLITSDQDLLVLHPFRGIPIMTPAQFLAALSVEGQNSAEPI